MRQHIERVVRQMNDHSTIKEIRPVSGGDINEAFYVATENQTYFIKGNQNVPSHFFKAEAMGLEAIRETETAAVPKVYYYDEPAEGEVGMIALEWIEGKESAQSSEILGQKLARMHQHTSNHYGFGNPTFVGELDQPNDWKESWVEYYRENRLRHQYKLALKNGRLGTQRREKLEKLIYQLERFIPASPSASLLHGDLWGGNYLTGADGEPYLIDPSILYGDPSFELAFTELFGGFSSSFYAAYEQISPLRSDYEEVKPVYQLFYLLVHLNLFGESYGPSVDRILQKYIG
ncbi:aminoglycoside phosphotransferase [Halobacillus andaensis]|uniref:Aminoglycoside phosphotransferase n=1 Tax=Halobacillus andaensis TaxID=1176239 RepID=A0A917B3Q1_HALAA|nr:fructosamine kinase family protein [Halobacillus andaensis]MBP2004472.1 fructosamine-3-kinase [Halobacillus andaensis]GGF21365.1 aminoglycoside phosphotransferase [Halobacillus andaensis]